MSTCCLQSIEICDFKSYKGLVKVSNFKQFTAVIGPNGSGKSNFMDAVGFALGESYHAFRVNNLSELIHGSAMENPEANKCYVTLVFLLEDGRTKSFKRTVTGTSRRYKYEVNETVVSSEAYQVELNRMGIHDHGKSCLIFQGTIESIAMKNPKERCAFFERMSGSVQFREEYNTSKLEMEEAHEKVQSTFEQMKILNLEMKVMSSDKKNATIFTDLKKKERNLKRNLQLFNLFHVEKDIEEVNVTHQSRIRKIEVLNRTRSEAKSRRDELKEVIQNMKPNEIRIGKRITEQETELDLHKDNLMKKQEKITFLSEKEVRISKSLANAEKKRESQKNVIQDLKESKQIFETELAALHPDPGCDSGSEYSPRSLDEQQLEEYSRLKLEAGKLTSVYIQELDSKRRDLQKDEDRRENEMRRKTEIDANIQLSNELLKKVKERKDSLKEQVDKNKDLLMEKENFRDTLVKEIAEAQKRLPELQNEKDKITETLKNAKDDKYSQQRAEMKEKCISQLRAEFPEVIDRLINLCHPKHHRYNIAFVKIFDKYADSIVVKDVRTAKECIQFLKNHMLRREMFIPLDNIDPQPIRESLRNIRDPPNVKLAYDVIKFPPEIDSAVRFVMKDTLICETIRDARKLSASRDTDKGRKLGYTCVSLDGTMFKKYGIISGGQSDLARQARKWDDNVIKQLELRKSKVEIELKAVLQKIRQEFTVALLDLEISALSNSNKYIQIHLDSVVKEQGEIEEKLRALEADNEKISNTIQEVNTIISEKEKVINDIKTKIDDIVDEVFRHFCQEIGYTNIREYETKDLRIHQQKREKIQQLRDHITRVKNLLEFEETRNLEGEVYKWQESLAETEAEIRKETKEKSNISEEIKNIEEKLQNERSALEKERAKIEEESKKYRDSVQAIRESTNQISNLSEEIKEYTSNCNEIRTEILRTCQIQQIQIPLHSGDLSNLDLSQEVNEEANIEIDYSDLPEAFKERKNKTETEEVLNREVDEIQGILNRIRTPNQKAAMRLKALTQQQRQMRRKLNEEREKAKRAQDRLETVKRRRTEMFNSFMTKVSDVIDNIYKHMTKSNSSQAFLYAQNPEEPYLDGIIYTCIAPGKKALTLDGLSGGERSIAALALLFAIQKAKPAPFFLLDEVDAALDSVNINKIVDCIQKQKQSVQFIVISLKYTLFCEADVLVGVTANEDSLQSCVYVFDLQKYRKPADHAK